MPEAPKAPEWEADVDLSPHEAAGLIREQFPELAPVRLELLGVGWDNTAYRVNGEWVFRFPRRALGARLTEREGEVLPGLAPHLPLPVPVPVHLGRPAGGYPYAFLGYRFIPGRTACRVAWDDAARARCARPLARFLKALHALPVGDQTLAQGPHDELERWNMRKRLPMLRERLDALSPELSGGETAAVRSLLERLAETPRYAGRPCWVHGDLYARHFVVDEALCPAGVIDWGDVHLGDPALDLSLALSFLPAAAREEFTQEYGPVDAETWRRARWRALFYGVVLTHYGREAGDPALRSAGLYALHSALAAG